MANVSTRDELVVLTLLRY